MSTPVPASEGTGYPVGGQAISAGGQGIFRAPNGDSLQIWVDPRIRSLRRIILAAEAECAEISIDTDEPETHLLLLHPTSYRLFDGFCHPAWWPLRKKRKYYTAPEQGAEVYEAWKQKVMLKESWVDKCLAAGRFLGEEDDWAGCRVGGPPVDGVKDHDGVEEAQADIVKMTVSMMVPSPDGEGEMMMVGSANLLPARDPAAPSPLEELQELPHDELVFSPSPVTAHANDNAQPDVVRMTTSMMVPSLDGEGEMKMVGSFDLLPARDSAASPSLEEPPELPHDELVFSPSPVADQQQLEAGVSHRTSPIDRHAPPTTDKQEDQPVGSTQTPLHNTSQPRRKRRKPNIEDNVDTEMLDASMLDTGPSRLQSPPALTASQAPPAVGGIFAGLRFYVDLSTKNRSDLLKELKRAGGQIAVEYSDATHVLVSKYQGNKGQWDTLVTENAPKGIWFVHREWTKKSIEEKQRLPEVEYCLPNSEVAALAVRARETHPGGPEGHQADTPAPSAAMYTDQIIREVHEARDSLGLFTERDVANQLCAKHGVYNVKKWIRLYREWARRTGAETVVRPRTGVSNVELAGSPVRVKPDPDNPQDRPLPDDSAPIKQSITKEELDEIFERECPSIDDGLIADMDTIIKRLRQSYGVHSSHDWKTTLSDWLGARGQWSHSPRAERRARQILGAPSASPAPSNSPPSVDELRESDDQPTWKTSTGGSARMTPSTIAVVLSDRHDRPDINASTSAMTLAPGLHTQYPAYSVKTWRNFIWDWRRGQGRFASHGPSWDGLDGEEEEEQMSEEPDSSLSGLVKQEPDRLSASPSKGNESLSPSKIVKGARMPKEEIQAILAKEEWRLERVSLRLFGEHLAKTYGVYQAPSWANHYTNWDLGHERWATDRRAGAVGPRPSKREQQNPSTETKTDDPLSRIPQAIKDAAAEDGTLVANPTLAAELHTAFGLDSDPKMRYNKEFLDRLRAVGPLPAQYVRILTDWAQGQGSFASVGKHWDGKSPSSLAASSSTSEHVRSGPDDGTSKQAGPSSLASSDSAPVSTYRGKHTPEEDLAMAQFAQAVRDRGDAVTARVWSEFAHIYTHRTPGAWAQYYYNYRKSLDRLIANSSRKSSVESARSSSKPVKSPSKPAESPNKTTGSPFKSTYSPSKSADPDAEGESDVPDASDEETPASQVQPGLKRTRQRHARAKRARQRLTLSKHEYEALARFIVENVAEGDTPTLQQFNRFIDDDPAREGRDWRAIWERDRHRSTLLPLIEQYRKELSGPTLSQRARPTSYTEEEERAMAEFILRSIPSDRPPKASDWMLFQKNHTKRSAASWTEHYRVYKPRIDALVKSIQQGAEPPARSGQTGVIELGSDEEEEEEVEEIVPIRPLRSRRGGLGTNPIVIDDDDDEDD